MAALLVAASASAAAPTDDAAAIPDVAAALERMDFAGLKEVLTRKAAPPEWLEACDAMSEAFAAACKRLNDGSWRPSAQGIVGSRGRISKASSAGVTFSGGGLSMVMPWKSLTAERRQKFLAGPGTKPGARAWLARAAYALWSGLDKLAAEEVAEARKARFPVPAWVDAVIRARAEAKEAKRKAASPEGGDDSGAARSRRARTPRRGDDWPRFRGPTGNGVSEERGLPTKWGPTENVLWKTPLPKGDFVASSPVVAGDRVFVTYGITDPPGNHVVCVDRETGRILWDRAVDPGPVKKVDGRAGFAAPTPCADASHVYVAFASAVVACLDHEGKLVWRKEFPSAAFDVVMGNSPFLHGGRVVLVNDQNGNASQFLAYDARTGELLVNRPRPGCSFAHSTPILIKVGGTEQLVASASGELQGLDPATGEVIWAVKAMGETASPACDGGLVYCDNGRGGPGVSVLPGGGGAAAEQKSLFRVNSDLGSAVVLGEYVYRQSGGKLFCMKLDTGERAYAEPVPDAPGWASPFATRDGLVYVGNAGKCYVVKAGPAFEVVSVNDLGDGGNASPAVSRGNLFFRGASNLWCIGGRPTAGAAGAAARPKKGPRGQWVAVSDALLADLEGKGQKPAWPGKTTGVVTDRTTGEMYLCIPGLGLWRSSDYGESYARYDSGAVSGRAETGWVFNTDPEGGRLACFMLDGASAWTIDGGRTWRPFAGMGRGWDYGAVDWSSSDPKTIFAFRHESGGEYYLSTDGATSWKQVGKEPGMVGLGVIGPDVLVMCRGAGIERSVDAGATWQKVSDVTPKSRVPVVLGGVAYWATEQGILVSKDKGATWQIQGSPVRAGMGPFFGGDERHMVVVGPEGFSETTDAGRTWRVVAPLPPITEVHWFGNFAWDPVGDVFYAARMGQPAYKYER